jgi:uncharacterized protein YjbI with pentapeptide repeats
MSNLEHMKILKRGVEAWNKWRMSHPILEPDLHRTSLRRADLRGVNLTRTDLSYADLSGADLVAASLIGADLTGADVSHADLSYADLRGADLRGTDFSYADIKGATLADAQIDYAIISLSLLRGERFTGTDLGRANFSYACLVGANLVGIDIAGADLVGADLTGANLHSADLQNADLSYANLSHANLNTTMLGGAKLTQALFNSTDLSGADLAEAFIAKTSFTGVDLRKAVGLEEVNHGGPSDISLSSIQLSEGAIPDVFLRGCGLRDWEVELNKLFRPGLTRTEITDLTYKIIDIRSDPMIQFYSAFISYSGKDEIFAKHIYSDLQRSGVRCWFAPEDMKIGDRIRHRIDDSIRLHDKLLLVLSGTSLASQWIEQEVETALEKEREQGGEVLFPVRLDDAVMKINSGWPALVKNTRHIGDFCRWENQSEYGKAFSRLLGDLREDMSVLRIG